MDPKYRGGVDHPVTHGCHGEEEEHKITMVPSADTMSGPYTVLIKFSDTAVTCMTVHRPQRLLHQARSTEQSDVQTPGFSESDNSLLPLLF